MYKIIEKLIYQNENGEKIEFSHRSVFHTNEVSGLSDINNTNYTISSMGQDGETDLGGKIDARDISIIGTIKQTDKSKAILLRRELTRILNPKLRSILIYEYGDFKRVIECKVDNSPVITKGNIFYKFVVNLLCLNPYWREESETKVILSAWVSSFSFPLCIPHDEGFVVGYREKSLIKTIHSNVNTGMKVVFVASSTVKNPYITNTNTGEIMKVNYTMKLDDIITIYTHYGKKNVWLLSGNIEQRLSLDVDSEYIQLKAGINNFKYGADENITALEADIYYFKEDLGV